MTANRLRVLDVHHHVGDPTLALAMPGSSGPAGADEEMQIRLATMDRNEVDARS